MALQRADVDTILTGNGTIKFIRPNPTREPDDGGIPGSYVDRVGSGYYPCKVSVNVPASNIELRTLPDDTGMDGINVVYQGAFAKFGDIMSPGYMYSDSFAGCEFFLYRGIAGAATGVHASKESGKVIDPTDYFRRRGVPNPIWHWQSQGKISDTNLMGGWFGAVFLVIDTDRIDCYALGIRNQKVMAVIEHKVFNNWR